MWVPKRNVKLVLTKTVFIRVFQNSCSGKFYYSINSSKNGHHLEISKITGQKINAILHGFTSSPVRGRPNPFWGMEFDFRHIYYYSITVISQSTIFTLYSEDYLHWLHITSKTSESKTNICKKIVHRFTRYEQVCLARLRFEGYFSHEGRSISRNVVSSNVLAHDVKPISLL